MTSWKEKYQQAHRNYQAITYPSATRDFGCIDTQFPDVRKANGLTRMIVNFLNWSGHRATRINVSGRLIKGQERQASGTILTVNKWMTSTTRKGTADISATIRGRAVMLEIKIRDKPSEYQLKEQERERRAGGVYEFIYTADEFFEWYEKFILSL